MVVNIHPSAIIDPSAEIADGVKINAYAVIGPNTKLESGVEIYPQAYIENSEIGKNTIISTGAVIGTAPQDLGYKGEFTKVIIGENCQIREHATVNRASGEGNITKVGNNCMLMTGAHIAHNCQVGDNAILANLATLGGHVLVGDYAFIGGMVVIHQNVRIGEMAIIGGFSATRQDLPPYAKTEGRPAGIIGINTIGLKRRGFTPEERTNLKKAFNLIWFSDLNTNQAIERIREEIPSNKYIDQLIEFINSSKRGVTKLSGKQNYLE
ncbi:MAG: acyl-[acyl-carrier-protein]--UDP-N-acetylglucosamine O-acyltransferase [Candidatus Melainabacteria bacterium RIFOXYA12_FULL_32_12]|nr:MAG: acyl-[acyl-carrier-protein]--UDP-N-acetylglucosamine O-acyltransferase [Candidatus Melainabacteria bacterium RIFOXYA2_FULL_32_9]OGI31169.1 MAG: acyl-[acyl-carrier-protein]--UDP-N-acetylglucosamine O-acyltransferase [Candidatus Melainabacteria bacterium RIFOXYA12_FULL_32_12]